MSEHSAATHGVLQPYPWQIPQWSRVNSLLAAGKLPHALLLRGPAGTGKSHFAQSLAQLLLCASPSDQRACGSCKYCRLFASGTHPDFFVAEPEEGSKAIRVEQIRDLIGFASKKAQFEGYRVVIVQPAENMNVNASNALLKCLEEPGGNTLIMLVTHQPSQLLPTVRSRCQSVDFPIPEQAPAIHWLELQLGVKEHANRLLSLAGGCPVKARALAEGDWQKQRDQTFDLWLALLQKKSHTVETAEILCKFPLVDVLEWLAGWYVDLARLSLNGDTALLDEDKRSRLSPLAGRLQPVQFYASYDRMMELRGAFMKGANFNPQMAMEGLLATLSV